MKGTSDAAAKTASRTSRLVMPLPRGDAREYRDRSRAGAKADHCVRGAARVRTGQLRANQAIVIEGEKIAQIVRPAK